MKKILSMILALAMIFVITMPIFAAAEETVTTPDSMEETADPVQPIDPADVSWLTKYINYVIIGICVVIGLLVKHCTALDNRYIPLIVAVIGLLIAVWTHWSEGITPIVILEGLFSGLASTGFHQVFKQLFIFDSK